MPIFDMDQESKLHNMLAEDRYLQEITSAN